MPKKKTQASEQPASALSTDRFRISDRLQMLLEGTRNRIGASCNVFCVEDSIASIAEALAWALHVSHQQGAPSVNLSKLRPRGASISTGGVSGGPVPFAYMFDAVVHQVKRDTYKKGAGICWLSWNHPDLPEFLQADFQSIYRGVYVPGNHQPEEQAEFLANASLQELLAAAYEKGKCFICKRPAPNPSALDEELERNLCTEVTIPHRGSCLLGVVNLAQYSWETLRELPTDFTNAALFLWEALTTKALTAQANSPLYCSARTNVQFGLGVSGLASLLANLGITYAELATEFEQVFSQQGLTVHEYCRWQELSDRRGRSRAAELVFWLLSAYSEATRSVEGKVYKAFCVQPSATGAYECADVSGYHSSPELQPVVGLRFKSGVHTIRKSQLRGDTKVVFHPKTETIEDVPYATYASLCSSWQLLLDSTGLGHSHSACFYGHQEFSVEDLSAFVKSARHNLYYRLPAYNPDALNKTQVGSGLGVSTDASDTLAALLQGATACSITTDTLSCDCAG